MREARNETILKLNATNGYFPVLLKDKKRKGTAFNVSQDAYEISDYIN